MSDVRLLLRQLGQAEERAPRGLLEESGREARMSARMDVELAGLVRSRRAWRTLGVATFAAAALIVLGLGLNRVRVGASNVGIGQEPLASGGPAQRASETARPVRAASPLAPPSATAPAARGLVPSSTPSSNSAAPSASTPAESTLAEENRLFKAAAEASRQGDTNGALAQLDQLLSQHPRSPLAQTAQVRKFRLLAKAGRLEAARREAERYLLSYPTGFAVTEAETLAKGSASAEPTAP